MARLLRQEFGQYRRNAIEHAFDVDVDHLVPLVSLECGEWRIWHQTRVQENNVYAAKGVFGQLNNGVVLGLLGDIQRLIYGLATGLFNLVGDALQLVCTARAQHDLGTFTGEQLGGGLADTGGCAGDDDDFIFDHDVSPGSGCT